MDSNHCSVVRIEPILQRPSLGAADSKSKMYNTQSVGDVGRDYKSQGGAARSEESLIIVAIGV